MRSAFLRRLATAAVVLASLLCPGLAIAQSGERSGKEVVDAQCSKCHRVGEGKETVGPDLSKVATKYKAPQILESILEPSKLIDPKYAAVILQTKSGDVLSGIVASKSETELVLRDAEKETRLALTAVERMVPQQKSLMPESLLQHLTAQEAADLVAYLESLK